MNDMCIKFIGKLMIAEFHLATLALGFWIDRTKLSLMLSEKPVYFMIIPPSIVFTIFSDLSSK